MYCNEEKLATIMITCMHRYQQVVNMALISAHEMMNNFSI